MNLRVAAYCRVSTDREDQANSLRSQQDYFRTYIENHAGWVLAGVYADEGLSGTSTRHRQAFHRMICAAEAGEFDLILTKEVSRFARNTVDTLEYTRKLRRMGAGVLFLSDNIDTRDNDGELRLTIMASMAQEESRKTSERVKWGQKRRMEAGVVFGNDSTYGFVTKGGALSIKEDEAAVVRQIYQAFLNEGKGTHVIARELYERAVLPPKSVTGKWSCVMIRRILRNEKYAGDLLQKKFITPDYLTHKKEENKGREEMVYLRAHHAPVVERQVWDGVQAELARRAGMQADGSNHSNRYWCSGKIRCGTCGARFVLRTTKRAHGEDYRAWGCHSRVHYGNWKQNGQGDYVGCNMHMVNDKTLTTCVQFVLAQLDLDYDAIVTELVQDIKAIGAEHAGASGLKRLEEKQIELERKKIRVMDAYFSQTISNDEMQAMKVRYDRELSRVGADMQTSREGERIQHEQQAGGEEMIQTLRAGVTSAVEVFGEAIERVTVCEHYIEIKVQHMPAVFRLWYLTSGTRAQYITTIEKWEML